MVVRNQDAQWGANGMSPQLSFRLRVASSAIARLKLGRWEKLCHRVKLVGMPGIFCDFV
jgi:transposase